MVDPRPIIRKLTYSKFAHLLAVLRYLPFRDIEKQHLENQLVVGQKLVFVSLLLCKFNTFEHARR